MKKLSLLLAAICLLSFCGCKEEFSRYPSVNIPQYADADYAKLLSDKNPEVIYNAVIILGREAEEMAGRLSDKEADKNSADYIASLNTYKRIAELVNSRDARVAAASLRFLQLFGRRYKAKEELLKPLLQASNNNPQALYEQIMALSIIADKGSNVPDKVLRKFLNSDSWIVSHSAYSLVNNLENERIRQELLNRYKKTEDEKEKLLLLNAFRDNSGDCAADFFLGEVLTTKSPKSRKAIYGVLGGSQNQEKVLSWLALNYQKISGADREYLFQESSAAMDGNFSAKLISLFLEKGFIAEEGFLVKLSEALEEYGNQEALSGPDREKLNNLLGIQEALSVNKPMAEQWAALQDKNRLFKAELASLQKDYDVINKEYINKIEALLGKYNVPDKEKQEYIKGVLGLRNRLKDLLSSDSGAVDNQE